MLSNSHQDCVFVLLALNLVLFDPATLFPCFQFPNSCLNCACCCMSLLLFLLCFLPANKLLGLLFFTCLITVLQSVVWPYFAGSLNPCYCLHLINHCQSDLFQSTFSLPSWVGQQRKLCLNFILITGGGKRMREKGLPMDIVPAQSSSLF